jgi:hypothetical protein
LNSIQNQNLYLKLVALAIEMSREAGVHPNSIIEMERKLLTAKGLQEHPMLNHHNESEFKKPHLHNKNQPYNLTKKLVDPEEQLSFLTRMEKEV